jgi:L,D-transpeptidase ErfK/SrfK
MNRTLNPPLRAFAIAVLLSLASACSLLDNGFWNRHAKSAPEPTPPPVAQEAAPEATIQFELAPDEDIVGRVQITTSSKEDTLTDIARRFNVGYEEIVRANPRVDPWLPGAGKPIVVPTQFILPNAPREGVIINVAVMRIYYFPPHKANEPQVVITHPIGIGKVGWKTPEGVTKIVRRQKDPVWHVPVSVIKEHKENGEDLDAVIGPGPDNPLGRYAFYLAWPSYLIHGTNKPAGVGLRSSHGCIRLYPEDIESFYDMIPVGTQVRVVNQPFLFGWKNGELYMQASGALQDEDANGQAQGQPDAVPKAVLKRIDKQVKHHEADLNVDLVNELAKDPRGIPVVVTRTDSSLEQALASAPHVQNRVPEGATWDGKSDLPMDDASYREMLSDRDSQDAPQPVPPAQPPPAKSGT